MASLQPLQDPLHTDEAADLVIEPAALAWARRLGRGRHPHEPVADFGQRIVDLLTDELRAQHVALWADDGDEFVVLASTGLSAGARQMRLSHGFPVVNVARNLGGTLRRDDDNHHGPRAPGLPGSSSPAYGMLLLDDAGPVSLLTISAKSLTDGEVDQLRTLMQDLDWD